MVLYNPGGIVMIPYKDIPLGIKESPEINSLRKFSQAWPNRKILGEYMESYEMGMKTIVERKQEYPEYIPSRTQLLLAASYYVLRKEFFKRMSPLVSRRSKDTIMLDNKKLLDKFDSCLLTGAEKKPRTVRRYAEEICSRME
jgi:hypothetical protein